MAKRILAPADLCLLQNPIDIQISPDGKRIAYVIQETSLNEDKPSTSLWMLRLDQPEAKPFRLTGHPTDASPRFAPDGERIAFISRRTDKAQLYVINASGGEAEQLKTEHPPSSTPLWSPDGSKIAFKALVDRAAGPRYPGEPEELVSKRGDSKGQQSDKQKKDHAHVITDINYRADGTGLICDQFAQLFVLDLETRQCGQLTTSEQRIGDFTWSRDGNALLHLVQNYDQCRARNTSLIAQIDIDNHTETRLLQFDGVLSRIDLAPNGRWLLISGTDNRCPEGTGVSMLWAVELHDQPLPVTFERAICLTENQGVSCMQAHWDHSGESVYFIKHWHGSTQVCRVFFSEGRTGEIVNLKTTHLAMVTHYDLAEDGTMVFIANDFSTPPELFLRDDDGPRRLTELNQSFQERFELCATEKFTYKGADNWEIEGWIVKPLNYQPGRRCAAVLSVHGGPTGAYYDSFQFPFQLLAHQGFAVVFTNPRGSVTYGSSFAQGCVNDLGGNDWLDISAGLDKAIEMGVVDENRVGIMGWSYGGFMTCWAVTQTDRFKAAVGGANISNWYTLYGCSDSHVYAEGLWGGAAFDEEEKLMQHSPIRHVRNVSTPIMLLHGEADIRCPIGQSEQFYTALRRLNKEAVLIRYPGQFHGFTKTSHILDRWLRTVAWFKHHLT